MEIVDTWGTRGTDSIFLVMDKIGSVKLIQSHTHELSS